MSEQTNRELYRLERRIVNLSTKWLDYANDSVANGGIDPVMLWRSAAEAVERLLEDVKCKGAANLRGEHIECDWPVDEYGKHDGWSHSNSEHELLWTDNREN